MQRPRKTCDLCDSENVGLQRDVAGYEYDRCARCGATKLASPGVAPQEMYQATYRKRANGERFGRVLETVLRRLHHGRAHWAVRSIPPGRVLDIGCGRGDLLASFARMGWQAEGVEISNALRDTQLGGNIRLHIGEFPNVDLEPGFDLVTAFHVLEHLPDFKAAMDRIEELVPTRGHFIFEVPNAGSAVHRLTGHEWFGRDYPHHIYQFTCKSLREALEKRGWTHLRTRQWSLEFGPYSVGQSLANALFPRWHNAFYECLQTPQRSPALLFRAALQFPVVIAGAIVYPAIHAATWASESSEIVRMHFQKR